MKGWVDRPKPTQVNDLPRVATYRCSGYTRCQHQVYPTRHSRCEQLAHSRYAVTGFSGIQTRVFQTRVKYAIHSATNAIWKSLSNHVVSAALQFKTRKQKKSTRLSWPGWQTCSRRFIHNSGHQSAAGWAQDRESSPARDRRSTTVPRNQLLKVICIQFCL